MTLSQTTSGLGARVEVLLSAMRSKLSSEGGRLGEVLLNRIRDAWTRVGAYGQSRLPWVRTYGMELVGWLREMGARLRGIDIGARTVQAVGAAVVLGTLYVAIWGVGPNLVAHPPEVVATRVAPIGSLTLQEPAAPQVAGQPSAANPAASSL